MVEEIYRAVEQFIPTIISTSCSYSMKKIVVRNNEILFHIGAVTQYTSGDEGCIIQKCLRQIRTVVIFSTDMF